MKLLFLLFNSRDIPIGILSKLIETVYKSNEIMFILFTPFKLYIILNDLVKGFDIIKNANLY